MNTDSSVLRHILKGTILEPLRGAFSAAGYHKGGCFIAGGRRTGSEVTASAAKAAGQGSTSLAARMRAQP